MNIANNEGNPVPLAQIEEPNTPPLEEVKTSLEEAFLPEIIVSTWTIEGCPTTGFINMVCSNQNQVIRDAVLGSRAILSGGELAGNIDSQGFVSQVTVQAGAVLTGGMLSGYVFNQGTIAEVTFVGAILQGGTLAGVIRNKSRVGGTLVEVIFAPNARLQGGKLQGRIRGDREAPALLESVKVLKGSILSGVKFGSGVLLEEGVIIEE